MSPDIAVVGLACRYPEADNPAELWENVLSQRRSFRRIPRERLSLDDHHSPDPATPDAIYADHAAVLEDYEFDRVRFRISGSTYRATDLTHWLALDTADAALADAGFADRFTADPARVSVVVGNTLTGEFSRASVLRLRWPYVRRQVGHALRRHGWDDDARAAFLAELERDYKAPFPEFGEDSLAGSLSNTIAGRICNAFDFGGGGYTVDGACSSSLLAVTTACEALVRGDVDFALAGGVDLSLDAFELTGFAKTQALATDLMRVYDERSAGFWPGEGCGMVALARYADAVEQGARIYATIAGWGISSDGRGGITRPEQRGQSLALDRAYRRAGYPISSVALFEGHGTGTAVGDATELGALGDARRAETRTARPAAIGSIKGNIGHTKAAAGVAGLIKAVLAVDRQVLPPTTGCERPHPELTRPDAALRVLRAAEPWPAGVPLRAAVSAMGFGGINSHITVEGVAGARRDRITGRERMLSASAHDAELIPLAGPDRPDVARQVTALVGAAPGLSFGQLRDLAIERAAAVDPAQPVRAAVLAATPAQFAARLETLAAALRDGTRPGPGSGVFLGEGTARPRIGFLFSGQGSPTYLDGGALARRFPAAAEVVAAAELTGGPDLRHTAIAQPAIVTAGLAGAAVLDLLGIAADVAIGHSLGELTALHWAGALPPAELVPLARARGRAMAECPGEPGAMVDLGADPETVSALLTGARVTIAAYNTPERTVVSGPVADLERVVAQARDRGIRATPLRVSHAFHSPSVAPAGDTLREYLKAVEFATPGAPVASTVTGGLLEPGTDLAELLVRQITAPVRFTDALSAAGPLDLLIEVGPGQVLTGLAQGCGRPAVASDAGGPGLAPMLQAVAAAYAAGVPVRFGALAAGRVPGRRPALETRTFLANPCELAPREDSAAPWQRPVPADEPPAGTGPAEDRAAGGSPLDILRSLVAARAELPIDAVPADSHLLTDLHLNSITVAQIAADAAAALGVRPLLEPTEFADATLGRLAEVLAAAEPDDGDGGVVSGAADWVRAFETVPVPAARPVGHRTPARWTVLADEEQPWRAEVATAFGPVDGDDAAPRGILLVLGARRDAATAHRLLAAAREAADPARCDRFAVLHHGGAAGLAKTLFLERPGLPVRVIEMPPGPSAGLLAEARAEAETGGGFAEVRLTGSARSTPRLRPLPVRRSAQPYLRADDVLLVTGGGKGIGALCAHALAAASGARVALLGRSPADDPEVAGTLDRFRDAGLDVRYLRADTGDPAAVRTAVARVRADLGEPTAVLHAAGVNDPARLADVTAEQVDRTLRPKTVALANLLAAVDPARLRLLLAFGSIIGAGGMPGEAHYALANDWLRLDVRAAARLLPGTRCRVLDWSVWSGAGMGERLGLLQSMLRRGVSPIGIDAGVEWCRRLVDDPDAPVEVVVTGRYGQLPTLRLDGADLSLHRFLDQPLVWYPGVELVTETTLSAATDPYLADHSVSGTPLVPAVLGLEAMAQVAAAVTGRAVTGFRDAELPRPISVPADGERTIRVAALAREDGEVLVTVRSDETSYGVDHFRARCTFGPPDPEPFPEVTPTAPETEPDRLPDGVYGRMLFHGPRFQRVRHYTELRARRGVAEVAVDDDAVWFGGFLSPALLLGDFGARDAFLHAAQACVPHWRVLPMAIGRIDLIARPATGPARVVAVERWSDRQTLRFDLAVLDQAGKPYEIWRDLTLRAVESLPLPESWPVALAVPYLERRLGELGFPEVRVAFAGAAGGAGRRERSASAFAGLLGPDTPVRYRVDGRPETASGRISAAHAARHTLAVYASTTVAGDLEPLATRDADTWRAMLGAERFGCARELVRDGRAADLDEAATRVWTAAECIRKAGLTGPVPLAVSTTAGADSDDGWVVFACGSRRIATVRIRLADEPDPVIVAVLTDR
ncbi:type I polyketide synthase [Jidongwangia harbinensis]|uniref:type I polyketide synthase n=1 Tax=Jidongwangia harbinensis TaxID=2878561 RepID=UPI001CD92F78|nr:type I polyketide synthase [Jidongwangia harbinensis]MCA2218282.1 SDR family NAD(P)-dependent oxidoreductase [Jidongwangia harbinensis]